MSVIGKAKQKASFECVDDQISNSCIIGIGSGSTVVYAVERLGYLQKQGKIHIKACIPSSFQASALILDNNLPLGSLNEHPVIDICFDGADEVDKDLNAIKGGGGCLLQEKLVISASSKWFIVADQSKDSLKLTEKWKRGVPIEILPIAFKLVMKKLENFGKPNLRMATEKAGPIVTDNGNFIVDLALNQIADPKLLNQRLIEIPGVVETGLFCGMADGVYFGMEDGTVKKVFRTTE